MRRPVSQSAWRYLSGITALAALVVGSGCTSTAGDPVQPLPGSGVEVAEGCPEGPYGTTVGEIIQGYEFTGYVAPHEGIGEAAQVQMSLCDFYNPTGEGTYGPDGVFPEGATKPKVLMINVSAVWCVPCQHESAEVLPEEYAKYNPQGMELLLVLADSIDPGEPAGFNELDAWVDNFPVTYPAAIDPGYQLGALFDTSQFPANFLVDARTMEIIEVVAGIPQESFFAKLEQALHEEPAATQ